MGTRSSKCIRNVDLIDVDNIVIGSGNLNASGASLVLFSGVSDYTYHEVSGVQNNQIVKIGSLNSIYVRVNLTGDYFDVYTSFREFICYDGRGYLI